MKFNFDKCTIYTLDDIFQEINKVFPLYSEGKLQEAYNVISKHSEHIDMLVSCGLKEPNLNASTYRAIYKLAGDICGDLGYYKESLDYYKKHLFFNLQIKSDFRDETSVRLFHFRNTKKYVLNNLKNNEITLVDPRRQNDIVDSPVFSWLDSLVGCKKHLKSYKNSFDYIRATSFCIDTQDSKAVENTLMWAHYANCHKGICVEYELSKQDYSSNATEYATLFRLLRIDYIDPATPEESIDFTKQDTELNLRTALATKSIDWQYEHEVRMIAYTPVEEGKYVQCVLQTPNPIKAIYFGVKCPKQRINAVMEIFKNRPEVKFFQMKINPQNIHRLLFEPYNKE